MAALVITPGNVLLGTGGKQLTVIAGETITQGMAVYKQTSDNRYYKGNSTAAATSAVDGISLNAASAGQPLEIMDVSKGGEIVIGAAVDLAKIYVLGSAVSGTIKPVDDVGTGEYVVVIGMAKTSTILLVDIIDPGDVAGGEVF